MMQGGLLGSGKRGQYDLGQAGQRDDVHGVVVEHRHELEGLAGAQVFEVVVRDEFAGQVALALHA